jgi:(S)-mandelate dehydrogenase
VMVDSGIRRGADIASSLCHGARFTFVGRATANGVAVGGLDGARKAIDILRRELDLVCGQVGCPVARELDARFLAQRASA